MASKKPNKKILKKRKPKPYFKFKRPSEEKFRLNRIGNEYVTEDPMILLDLILAPEYYRTELLLEVLLFLLSRRYTFAELSKRTGLSRTALYKIFRKGSEPRFETIVRILFAFGITLEVSHHPPLIPPTVNWNQRQKLARIK